MSQLDYNQRSQQPAKSRLLVMVLLVTILCIVSFVVGIMVGKGGRDSVVETTMMMPTAPIPLKPENDVAAKVDVVAPQKVPAEQLLGAKTVEIEAIAPAVIQAAELSADDGGADPLRALLPAVEQMPLGSGINQPPAQDTVKAAAQVSVVVPDATAAVVVKDAGRSIKKDVVLVLPKVEPLPTVTKTATTAAYVVQVASFKNKNDAETLQGKLLFHFPAHVQEVDLGAKGVWFRVLVGPVDSADAANGLKQRLKDKMKMDGFVKKISRKGEVVF